MKGIQQRRTHYGSLDNTIIAIEADESTPLLVDRQGSSSKYEKPIETYGLSTVSVGSSNLSSGSACSFDSTKSFKSHFLEVKVLILALLLSAALGIAIYLLITESRLPPITLSLDLVSRDIWNNKILPTPFRHLEPDNVDYVIIMQTGNRNCDTSVECLEVLKEMQDNETEDLAYNFLIGGDGHTYEVRGWLYQSGRKGVPQERSLVIGVIGNFDLKSPKNNILRSVTSLIKLSTKRQLISTKYSIYGLLQNRGEKKEGQMLFRKIIGWPEFKDFLTSY